MKLNDRSIFISPERVLKWLILIWVVLVGLHIFGQYLWHIEGLHHLSIYIDRFGMDEEVSAPTWYAASLLLAISFFMWLMGLAVKETAWKSRMWQGLAVVFLLLSIDEGSSIHEVISDPIREILNIDSGFLYFAWVVPAFVLVGGFLVWVARLWISLPTTVKTLMAMGLTIYVGGAVGVELLEARYFTERGVDFGYTLLVAIEESMELVGLILILYSTMRLQAGSRLVISFGGD